MEHKYRSIFTTQKRVFSANEKNRILVIKLPSPLVNYLGLHKIINRRI